MVEFCNPSSCRAAMKADWRIAVKDYFRNQNLKIQLQPAPVAARRGRFQREFSERTGQPILISANQPPQRWGKNSRRLEFINACVSPCHVYLLRAGLKMRVGGGGGCMRRAPVPGRAPAPTFQTTSEEATGVSFLKSLEKICNPAGHRILVAAYHTICTEHQYSLRCKQKNHPICPRLRKSDNIRDDETTYNKLPHNQSGKPSVLSLSSHKSVKWPNEKS